MRTPSLTSSALLNLVALAAPLAVAFITLPIMIAGLGPERFGVLSIAWLLLTYLSELGFGTTTTYYGAEAIGRGRHTDLGAVFWTTTALQVCAATVIAAALAAAVPWLVGGALRIPPDIVGEARSCFYLLAVSLPLLAFGRSLRGLIDAARRFDLQLAVQTPITIATYALAAVGARAGWALPTVMLLIVTVRTIGVPACYAAARSALPAGALRLAIETRRVREILSFGGWATVSTVVSPMLLYVDRFIIGALLSMTAVTLYAAPFEAVARLAIVPLAVSGALFPALTQLNAAADRSTAERIARRGVAVLAAVFAPLVVLMLGGARDLLTLWLGPEYAAQSALAVQILAIGVLVNALAHVPYALLQSMRRPDLPARFHLLELPLHTALAWALISRFGIPGAALAWTLRMAADAALLFAAAHRTRALRLHGMRPQFVVATAAVVLPGVCAATASVLVPSLLTRVLLTAALATGTAALHWGGFVFAAQRRRIWAPFRPAA